MKFHTASLQLDSQPIAMADADLVCGTGHGGMSANREQAITQDTMVDRYRNLYAKYGRDLMKVKLRAGPCAAKGLSSDMELELAYLRIRDTKPSMVRFSADLSILVNLSQ